MLSKVIVGVGWCVQLSLGAWSDNEGRLQTESQADDEIFTARGRRHGPHTVGEGGVGTEEPDVETPAEAWQEERQVKMGPQKGTHTVGEGGVGTDEPDVETPAEAWPDVEAPAEAWQVKMGPQKRGLNKATMVLPAALRFVTNIIGGSVLAAGYAAGAASAKLFGGKAVDSPAFALGFKFFMMANGVFPRFEFRPIEDHVRAKLSEMYKVPEEEVTADHKRLAPIIVSNHISFMDGGVLTWLFGTPKIVAMAAVRNLPVAGKLGEEMGVIYVDHKSNASKSDTKQAIRQHCRDWRFGDRPLLVFPEGTCTNGLGFIPFRRGAFLSGAPVRPVLLVPPTGPWDMTSVPYKMTPEGVQKASEVEWATQFVGHFLHRLDVIVLQPYIPSADEKENPTLYARKVEELMLAEYRRLMGFDLSH